VENARFKGANPPSAGESRAMGGESLAAKGESARMRPMPPPSGGRKPPPRPPLPTGLAGSLGKSGSGLARLLVNRPGPPPRRKMKSTVPPK